MREHQPDDHHREHQSQRQFVAKHQVEQVAQVVTQRVRARFRIGRREQQANARGQPHFEIARKMVAVDESAGGNT